VRGPKAQGRNIVFDVIYLVATVVFFLAGAGYLAGCRKLQ
jgi:hypothetical protein